MRVLVACEFSGVVRDAFRKLGYDAVSCDLLPTEREGPHIQDDVLKHLNDGWDMMIAHHPCTHLAVSGAAWFKKKEKEQKEALDFVDILLNASIPRICVENPVSIISTHIRKPDQIIQPYHFGHPESKTTCLWLKNLPKLKATCIVEPKFIIAKDGKKYSPTHYYWQTPDRWKKRSRTYQGVADAMATQWGNYKPLQLQIVGGKQSREA